jgi:hypothetical protein
MYAILTQLTPGGASGSPVYRGRPRGDNRGRRFPRAARLALLIAAGAVRCASAEPGAAAAREGPPCDAPRKLSFQVALERGPGRERLIHMSGEYEAVFSSPMDDIVGALWDFESWPGIFKRI